MTASDTVPATDAFPPAHRQTDVPREQLITSVDAGLIIHRTGLIKNEFLDESIQFGLELVGLINRAQAGYASIFLYRELFGLSTRLHWMLHLRQPNDYSRLLTMVDEDQKWREIADMDRLPARGGGGWERMFTEAGIMETVICPQHGLSHPSHRKPHEQEQEHDHEHGDTFQPAAALQTALPRERLLNSATAPVTVHRVAQARYAVREEARLFGFEWANRVNEAMGGRANAFVYEEMWGRQDRLHTLIHLASLDDYRDVLALAETDEGMRDVLGRQWVPGFQGGGGWQNLFLDGSIRESSIVSCQNTK